LNSDSSNITILRATEWKRDAINSQVRVVLAYTGPGHTPLVTWEEWQHNDSPASFGSGHYFRTTRKETDEAHRDFESRRGRMRLTEQVPPQRGGAKPIGAEVFEEIKVPVMSEGTASSLVNNLPDFDLAEERRRSLERRAPRPRVEDVLSRDLPRGGVLHFGYPHRDPLAGGHDDLTDELGAEDRSDYGGGL
jgi:hypothetical protein